MPNPSELIVYYYCAQPVWEDGGWRDPNIIGVALCACVCIGRRKVGRKEDKGQANYCELPAFLLTCLPIQTGPSAIDPGT